MSEIVVDIRKLKKFSLTLDSFVVLNFIYEKREAELEQIKDKFSKNLKEIIDELERNMMVKVLPEGIVMRGYGESFIISEKNKKLEEYFDVFFNTFPLCRPSKSPLRSTEKTSKTYIEAKKKFLVKMKSEEAAKEAIEVLKAEVAWRNRTTKLEFMHNIITWLNQNDFETYKSLLNCNNSSFGKDA